MYFPAWEPPTVYANRYEWRQSALYHQLVAAPQTRLIEGLPSQTQLRYSEIRAVIGGVRARARIDRAFTAAGLMVSPPR